MEFDPLGGRNSNNDRIVNLCKFKDFGPSLSMWATDLAPPTENQQNQHIKTLKHKNSQWLKKGRQKFWEIDEIFSGIA